MEDIERTMAELWRTMENIERKDIISLLVYYIWKKN